MKQSLVFMNSCVLLDVAELMIKHLLVMEAMGTQQRSAVFKS